MSFLYKPIGYLEYTDFNPDGTLKIFKDKKAIIMVQANYCGHCTNAKPAFQEAANKNKDPNIVFLTIQGDDGRFQNFDSLMRAIKPFQGFPDYFKFINGKYVPTDLSDRSVNGLLKFIN